MVLGEFEEVFEASFEQFSRDQYQRQWREAVRLVLKERRTAALFYNVEIGDEGMGCIWLYPIVPSEFAGITEGERAHLSDFPAQEDAGIYVGERFMFVTVDVSNFKRGLYREYEDGSKADEIALYYIDLSAPERFFVYLDDRLAHASHWYFPNSDLEAFLAEK